MRDWLISDGAVEVSELDDELRQHAEWQMVRDLANKTKHQKINRYPKDPNWIAGLALDGNALLSGRHGIRPYILFDGNSYDLDCCIVSVWEMWQSVFAKIRLDPAQPENAD